MELLFLHIEVGTIFGYLTRYSTGHTGIKGHQYWLIKVPVRTAATASGVNKEAYTATMSKTIVDALVCWIEAMIAISKGPTRETVLQIMIGRDVFGSKSLAF